MKNNRSKKFNVKLGSTKTRKALIIFICNNVINKHNVKIVCQI